MNDKIKELLDEAESEKTIFQHYKELNITDSGDYAKKQVSKLLKIVYILAKENEELTDKVNELSERVKALELS